ncbi:MAG TPA: hypothetical protein VJ110_02010 [Candidatus Nanoarchaeia archaeon]|nr:hypothetical protein [Candidatus Nanoarchaeia archaeon]
MATKTEVSLKEGKGEKAALMLRDTANKLAVPLSSLSDNPVKESAY